MASAGTIKALRYSTGDLEVVAKTGWAEARGEPLEGRIAVPWVIRTRAEDPGRDWWGDTLPEVCLKPFQFSCWLDNHPQSQREAMNRLQLHKDAAYRDAWGIAKAVLDGNLRNPVPGATHYMTKAAWPFCSWARRLRPDYTIGNHVFFKLGANG